MLSFCNKRASTCVSILAHVCHFSTRTSLCFHLHMFQGHGSLADHLLTSFQTLHTEWSLNFGSSDGCLRLHISFRSPCRVIQSQAALACASCARSLGSSNRCPGVFGPEYLFCSFPPSALCQLSELYHAPCSLYWQLPRFGLKISSYSSITTLSGGLLLIFMEFLSSCLVASFQKNVQRRSPGGYLILHNCL